MCRQRGGRGGGGDRLEILACNYINDCITCIRQMLPAESRIHSSVDDLWQRYHPLSYNLNKSVIEYDFYNQIVACKSNYLVIE